MSEIRLSTLAAGASLLAFVLVASASAEPPGGMPPHPGKMMLERSDTDGDGAVTREEFMAGSKKRFEAADANKDGFIEESERTAMATKLTKRFETTPGGPGKPEGGPRGLSRIDTDGDGKVSLAEREALDKQMFDRLDADTDGKLTSEELSAMQRGHGPKGPAGPGSAE